jgi:hypothetical protein
MIAEGLWQDRKMEAAPTDKLLDLVRTALRQRGSG